MDAHGVVVAGGGPTGMMLAGELALAGVDVVVVEPRTSPVADRSRAGGLHARTIEVLDQRGIAERFLVAGQVGQVQLFNGTVLDISDFPARCNHGLALPQREFEPILAGWVDELGVAVRRGLSVAGFAEDEDGVDVELSDGRRLRAGYLVGCDGGRSTVRKAAGIEFAGWAATTSWILAEVELDEEPEYGMRPEGGGIGRVGADGPISVVIRERTVGEGRAPDLDELRDALATVYGTDYGLRTAHGISRFTDMARQAVSYRQGRVLLAGDAAHVHPPQGGQGLNTGVQDAVNLGWKLAQVVDGASPPSLLDTYHAERHPVGARVLRHTMAQVALTTPDERHQALRELVADLVRMDGPRRHIAGTLSGLDIHYDLGGGHPLVGWRVPDLDLDTTAGPTRVFELLHEARPVLLDLGGPDRSGDGGEAGGYDRSPWADRVLRVSATTSSAWELPVVGAVPAPAAVLIRPDGHAAWAGELADPGLPAALTTWFGPGTAV